MISAIGSREYELTPFIIASCEKAGVKLSIIPFYAGYMPAHPQFDNISGIPLMNIRTIPLDEFANAFIKRVEHDIWYIENWSVFLDLKILFTTVFGGKFINEERK